MRLGLAALPALAWLLFRIGYYGQWLPNSFFAKRTWQYGSVGYLRAGQGNSAIRAGRDGLHVR